MSDPFFGGAVEGFFNSYRFLSNFWPCAVVAHFYGAADGAPMECPSVEHAYQAMKAREHADFVWIATSPDAKTAKARGRRVNLRPGWEGLKLSIMRGLVLQKFHDNPELRELLLATGDRELVEGNYWNDTYWGVCRGVGQNHLGKILMEVRKELRS